MITGEDIDRNLFPEMEGKEINDEVDIDIFNVSYLLFVIFHGILYTVFFSLVVNYTTVFCFIDGELMFNITKFGRLLYKVFDIQDYFL